MKSPILCAESVSHSVSTTAGPLNILSDVSLNVAPGESVAIQGASGSGKSTLLGVLAGMDVPQSGKVMFEGENINNLDEDQRAALRAGNVGFVFQSFYLLDDLTALENVILPLELFGHQNARKSALEWLDRLGLSHRSQHFPRQLSGGEQQRVALCRAFSVKPSLLFSLKRCEQCICVLR